MAVRRNTTRRPTPEKKSSIKQEAKTGQRLWAAAAFLMGMLLVWAFLTPLDATSVFIGEAIPQNLFWLLLGLVTAVAAVMSGVQFRFGRLDWIVAGGSLVWLIVVAVMAGRENNPRVGWNGFWQVIALAAAYFSARGLLLGERARLAIGQIVIVGCMALAFQGLYQVFIGIPADRARYLADPESVLSSIGLDAPPGSSERKRFEDRLLGSSEPSATFALANSLATLLSGGLLLMLGAVGGVAANREVLKPQVRTVAEVVLIASVAIVSLTWFLTLSRSAYVAFVVGVVYWLFGCGLKFRQNRIAIGVGIFSLTMGLMGGGVWLLRNDSLVLSEAPKSLAYRLEYWIATARMLGEHWLFGIGLGNFQGYYPLYKLPMASETVADPHNWILDVFVTLSLPIGLVLLVWLVRRLRGATSVDGSILPKLVAKSAERISGQGLPDEVSCNIARYLRLGAIAGGVLCALGLGSLAGLDLAIVALSWGPAALIGTLIGPTIGPLTQVGTPVVRAAAIAMLTCLLASGSWQASGIAVPLLLLLLIGNPTVSISESFERQMAGPAAPLANGLSGLQSWRRWVICVLPALGLLCFVLQAWRPTTTSWALLQRAGNARTVEEQFALADAAVAADPLDTENLRWTALLSTSIAKNAPPHRFVELTDEALHRFAFWLSRDTVKPLNWESAAKNVFELAAKASDRGFPHAELLKRAIYYYREAAARYPSSAVMHAQLGLILAVDGKWEPAQQELDTAVRLSEASPHLDKKLSAQLIWAPMLPEGVEGDLSQLVPMVPAEPLVKWLRTQKRE